MIPIRKHLLRTMLIAASLWLFSPFHGALVQAETDASFTDAQKTAIGRIIRDYLLENPELMREVFAALEDKETRARETARKDILKNNANAIFNAADSAIFGNPEGDVTLVEFFDYNCGFCKRALADLEKLVKNDPNIKVVMKEFPILSRGSFDAARVSIAVNMQDPEKYRKFHAALLNARGRADEAKALSIAKGLGLDMARLKEDMKKPEVKMIIARDRSIADALGINGTPAYILDDKIFSGAVGVEKLRKKIAAIRKDGCKYC